MMKSEVITACRINNAPKKPGDIVEVDENTFHNLSRKKVLKAAGGKPASFEQKITKVFAPAADVHSPTAADTAATTAGGTVHANPLAVDPPPQSSGAASAAATTAPQPKGKHAKRS